MCDHSLDSHPADFPVGMKSALLLITLFIVIHVPLSVPSHVMYYVFPVCLRM